MQQKLWIFLIENFALQKKKKNNYAVEEGGVKNRHIVKWCGPHHFDLFSINVDYFFSFHVDPSSNHVDLFRNHVDFFFSNHSDTYRLITKICDMLKCLNRHRSKSIKVTKLSFCQCIPPMSKWFWQKNRMVTHILFDLCLFKHFSMSQIFVISL